MAKIGAPAAAVHALIEAFKDKGPQMRIEAAWSVGEIGASGAHAIPELPKLLQDPDNKVGEAAKGSTEKGPRKGSHIVFLPTCYVMTLPRQFSFTAIFRVNALYYF